MSCPKCEEHYVDNLKVPKVLKCGHTYCHDCLLEIYIQLEGIICPQCEDLSRPPPNVKGEDFIKSLTTNYLAYHDENSATPRNEEAKTRSQYYKFAQEVTKAKEAYIQPLMSTHISQDGSGCASVFVEIVKYLAFTLPFFAALIAYVIFVHNLLRTNIGGIFHPVKDERKLPQ